MTREPEIPVFAREDLVLDLERLRANAREKTMSSGKGSELQERQEPPKVEKKPAAPKPEAPAAIPAPGAPRPPEEAE